MVVQPLSGWREFLSGLSICPAAIALDCRAVLPQDVFPLPTEFPAGDLRILVSQHHWADWSSWLPAHEQSMIVAIREVMECTSNVSPCISSVGQLQQLAAQRPDAPEVWLLPAESAGLCGETAGFVLIQEALRLFSKARLVVLSTTGPEMAAALLHRGVDTVLLGDQLTLLSDYPIPTERKKRIVRLQRGVIRRYLVQTSAGEVALQVAPLNPREWRPADMAALAMHAEGHLESLLLHNDERLAPMGEGVLLSCGWSQEGMSCSDLLALYQRCAAREVGLQVSGVAGRTAMADWLGTRLPVVQGPMTRVSDCAAFARAVATAGAMPVIAAAMLPPERLAEIMRDTASFCAEAPWGVGLLAFRPQADLQPQIEQVLQARPDLIVLAGGQQAQIAQFGDLADRVILHSPTPELFARQLDEGCRKFILEGRECGGHTGPCSSLALWEGCLQVLTRQPQQVQEEVSILFAGGIHGACSTALITDLLHRFGLSDVCHGFLVGTLTLFSQEAVTTGAISPLFQKVLLDCKDTVLLETAPGHQSRCAVTPFADEFLRQRSQALQEGLSGSELATRLDGLILGRLRLATKGLRREENHLVPVTEDEQLQQGMFMVGEVAALQHSVEPLQQLLEQLIPADLHDLQEASSASSVSVPEPIAITGMAVALPGASSLIAYWSLIVRQECQVRIVPEERWPSDVYYTPEGSSTSVVSRWGTFIEPTVIDLAPYPLTPAQAAVTEPTQILALDLVSQALGAVGPTGLPPSQRERTAVVFAASGGVGELGQAYTIQTALASDPERFGPWLSHLPLWTNSTFPGLLSNVTAGRVSNAFDLSGANLIVDAACASALAAVDVAIAKLRSGECDRVIVGSIDNLQGPFPYFCFSQSGALSRQGQSRPFCIDSDGIVIGEGCAVIVLERLETASRSGAEIHAVIDAIGSSSDGKGRSLTAPSHRGQMLAFERAFAASDRHPSELRYYEAHGTGTPVGDRSEISALTGFLLSHGVDRQRCAVGSVKAQIGHTKATAGLAGLIKAALALEFGTLPGQQPIRQPHPELSGEGPVYIPSTPSPWPATPGERLAAVSAFGFGGTNFMVLLSDRHRRRSHGLVGVVQSAPLPASLSVVALPLRGRDPVASLRQHREQLEQWLLLMAGVNRSSNAKLLDAPWLPRYSPTWESTAFLALDRNRDDCQDLLGVLERQLQGDQTEALLHVSGLAAPPRAQPPVVLLFPGQGSVYPGMGATWMLSSPRVRQAIDLLQTHHPNPDLITRVLGGSRTPSDRLAFWKPSVMQIILMLHQLAALDLLSQLGLRPNAVLGHSIGDYLALHASGCLPIDGLVQLVVGRALCLERFSPDPTSDTGGGMLVVKEPLADCELRLAAYHELTLANRNAPAQAVVAGPNTELSSLQALLESKGIEALRLDLPVAYHHPSLQPVALEFADLLEHAPLQSPDDGCKVWLSTDPGRELKQPQDILLGLRQHMCGQVDFVESVLHMETALPGAIYVDVGPRQTGSRLLQANGVAADRILRMDDREDPASQPLRVAFELLHRGLPLDEAALMRLASAPRQVDCRGGSRYRLPYLVNGHAAVPLDGRPLPPSPLVPVISPNIAAREDYSMSDPGSDQLLEVYTEYQKTMRKFLESQDQVFSAMAGVHPPSPPVAQQAVSPRPLPASTSLEAPVSLPTPAPAPKIAPVASSPPSVQPIPHTDNSPVSSTLGQRPASKPADGVSTPFSSEVAMQNFITDVLVERTGYPPELLDLNAHLESDLGIDSIKQVEVLGILLDAMPSVPNAEQMQEIRAAARDKQTILELSRFMLSLHEGKV